MKDRLRIDLSGPQGSGKTLMARHINIMFQPSTSNGQILASREVLLRAIMPPAVYDDGVPPDYHPNKDATPLAMLRDFVQLFEDGAQGCMMDHEDAKLLALGIKQALSALDQTYRTMFLMTKGRPPRDDEMGL